MKLRDLFTNGEHIPEHFLDHEVDHCVAMDAPGVKAGALRYWNGKDTWPFGSLPHGGVLLMPRGQQLGAEMISDIVVFAENTKASFMRAMRKLHPQHVTIMGMPVQCGHHIGDGTRIHPCVEVLGSVFIGNNSSIGGIGFGFTEGERNPHIGGVVLHDGVEIGSNTCIDRGCLGDTVIGERTKIDNRVHIAHNVRIGKECQIVAGAVIGGSAVLGDGVFVGINASIKNKVRIGDGAIIGMGAVVLHDVPAGNTVVGNPAQILTNEGYLVKLNRVKES